MTDGAQRSLEDFLDQVMSAVTQISVLFLSTCRGKDNFSIALHFQHRSSSARDGVRQQRKGAARAGGTRVGCISLCEPRVLSAFEQEHTSEPLQVSLCFLSESDADTQRSQPRIYLDTDTVLIKPGDGTGRVRAA